MKVGIYLTGLGQNFTGENVEKYATRLMNEMRFSEAGTKYVIKRETEKYHEEQLTTIISICKQDGESLQPVYKFYDFKYEEILTKKFNEKTIIVKNLLLFLLVIRKIPSVFSRLVNRRSFNHPFLALYIFSIFLILSLCIISLLPASINLLIGLLSNEKSLASTINIEYVKLYLDIVINYLTPIMSLLLIFVPGSSNLITRLATEFICVNDYIEYGTRKQIVLGNLECLLEFIIEREQESEVHFHTYSFGSIIAIDFLFPFGSELSNNIRNYVKGFITIGSPFEFFNAYYPHYYTARKNEMENSLQWINVYSNYDALASNFRKDRKVGVATECLKGTSIKPINFNYEVSNLGRIGIYEFVLLKSFEMHKDYWDDEPVGRSCLAQVFVGMKNAQLL